MDWMKLKSGSDVRGVAVGENAPLTEHVAMCLGMAFARYVAKHVGKPVTQVTIAIGRDSRISGPALLHAGGGGCEQSGRVRAGFWHVHDPGNVHVHHHARFPAGWLDYDYRKPSPV